MGRIRIGLRAVRNLMSGTIMMDNLMGRIRVGLRADRNNMNGIMMKGLCMANGRAGTQKEHSPPANVGTPVPTIGLISKHARPGHVLTQRRNKTPSLMTN